MGFMWYTELLWLLPVICNAILVKFWWSRRRLRELAALIPGPLALPFIGNTLVLLAGPERTFAGMRYVIRKYGTTFRVWLGTKLYVGITDPQDVEAILCNKQFLNRDVHMMKVLEPYTGQGLITSRGEYWRKHRKIIVSTFHVKILEQFAEIFNKNAQILTNKLESHADGNAFEVYTLVGLSTLDMICETAMGTEVNAQLNSESEIVMSIGRMLHLLYDRAVRPWLMFDWIFNLTYLGREQHRTTQNMHDFAERVITKKYDLYHDKVLDTRQEDENQRQAFLDLLMTVSGTLSREEMRNEVYTLMITGQETTATTVCYTLVLLALHPQHQEQVVQELANVFQDDAKRPVRPTDLANLPYLDRVIKETMRLFPAAPVLPREIHKEVKLSKCTLPAGCTAVIINYGTHRDPRYFPEPEKFDPDRFLPENVKTRHPYSYIPFGAGPRMCVGYKYAMMQMKTVLATVLRRYQVLPACTSKDLNRLEIGLFLKPAGGFQIKMLPRPNGLQTTLSM